MWSRKRIDIGWRDLLFGAWCSLGRTQREPAQQALERTWSAADDTLACLSVRTGFDLLWTELNLPPGSEVLMSAVTIRDMARIVQEHALIPIPIDLIPSTMAPDPESVRKAITERTRAIVVAHLFGAILDLTEIAAIAREHGLLLIEDCAQAFDGHRYRGHAGSAVVMFSFGPIKTATALAGGLLTIRDTGLLRRMRIAQAAWPEQPQGEFLRRVRTYAMLKLISGRLAFGCLVAVCRLLGRDYDAMLNGAVRNFPAEGFFASLRRQPCTGLLRLMERRISLFDLNRQNARAALGRIVEATIRNGTIQKVTSAPFSTEEAVHEALIPSASVDRHTWWVFPVCVSHSAPMIEALRTAGFDATSGSQLQPIEPPAHSPGSAATRAASVVRDMLFLPFYPEMSEKAAVRMAQVVAEVLGNSRASAAGPARSQVPAVSAEVR